MTEAQIVREALYLAARGPDLSLAPVPGTPVGDAHLALDRLVAERDRYRQALEQIASTSHWYAENDQRDPHEVDHALCVEVLDLAERALEVDA